MNTYTEFVEAVNTFGFLPFSRGFLPGFPSVSSLTKGENWFQDNPETDPWQWKDRAATQKDLAFGCVFGGHKGFISPRMYSLFYAACRPPATMTERYNDGVVPQAVWRLYQEFLRVKLLDTSDIRRFLGVSKKKGVCAVDSAVKALQKEFYITISGNRSKISAEGREYGWPSNLYELVDDWAQPWLSDVREIDADEAKIRIVEAGTKMCPDVDPKAFSAALFGRGK